MPGIDVVSCTYLSVCSSGKSTALEQFALVPAVHAVRMIILAATASLVSRYFDPAPCKKQERVRMFVCDDAIQGSVLP